jgi:hypothetical protein
MSEPLATPREAAASGARLLEAWIEAEQARGAQPFEVVTELLFAVADVLHRSGHTSIDNIAPEFGGLIARRLDDLVVGDEG